MGKTLYAASALVDPALPTIAVTCRPAGDGFLVHLEMDGKRVHEMTLPRSGSRIATAVTRAMYDAAHATCVHMKGRANG